MICKIGRKVPGSIPSRRGHRKAAERTAAGGVESKRRLRRSAFTLLEVMLVLVIIAAIAGIAVVNIGGFQTRALTQAAEGKMKNLKTALEAYKLAVFTYPQQLDALYEKPSGLADESKWYQVIKEPVGLDPWGNPYEYKVSGDSYELKSLGPDGQSGTEDDIVA